MRHLHRTFGTSMTHDLAAAAATAQADGAPEETEITPAMLQAGCQVLRERFLSLDDVDEFPAIVRIVYEAMQESRLKSAHTDR
jgi:hypothetical protein